MKTRPLDRLAEKLRRKHVVKHSWRKTALACGVLTVDGRPNPGLAQRIATKGYDPAREETRLRLGLPPVCITCGRKVKRLRHVPAWVEQAVQNLKALEATAQPEPAPIRLYGRGGKRVRETSKINSSGGPSPGRFESKNQTPLLN